MDARERITQARTGLLLYHPFFAHLALRLEVVEDRGCGAFWTDGKRMGYDPAFVARLTPAQVQGVIAHEVMHCVSGHPWRRDGREHKRWNLACDYAIDPIVLSAGLDLPDVGFGGKGHVRAEWKGLSAEEIYQRLSSKGQEQEQGQGGQGGQGKGQDGGNFGEVRDGAAGDEGTAQQADWQVAAVQAAKVARAMGKLPGAAEALVRDLLAPRVDWRAVLARFVQTATRTDYTYRVPNRRYLPHGLYLPTLHNECVGEVVVAVDTSGSISDDELRQFGGELSGVLSEAKPEKVYVLYCDARVHRVQEYEPGDPLDFRPTGRGGTDFRPVFQWTEEQGLSPACLIYLTDLDGQFPETAPDYPVLWVSVGREAAPFGETVRLG